MLSIPVPVFAESSYVLPYPSFMPGSKLYNVRLVWEEILQYWHFGDFGQFHFNLKQSDKYLVEAKTLFDYKQYLLANNALKKSNMYFEKIYPNLLFAKNNGKNTSEKEIAFKEASQKHIKELLRIKKNVPSTFDWTPEKQRSTVLKLWESIDHAIKLREKRLSLDIQYYDINVILSGAKNLRRMSGLACARDPSSLRSSG